MSTQTPATSLPPNVPPVGCERASSGVILEGLEPHLLQFLAVAGQVHLHLFDEPLIITSAVDSIHGTASKHYKGQAVDLRMKDKPPIEQSCFLLVLTTLARRFGLTVFDESNLPGESHVHMETAG